MARPVDVGRPQPARRVAVTGTASVDEVLGRDVVEFAAATAGIIIASSGTSSFMTGMHPIIARHSAPRVTFQRNLGKRLAGGGKYDTNVGWCWEAGSQQGADGHEPHGSKRQDVLHE